MAWKKDFNSSDETGNRESRINAAGLINSTLERLWMDCYNAMANSNYLLWNTKLDAIWAILGGDEAQGGDADKEINSMDLKIYQTGSLSPDKSKGFYKEKNPNRALQYQLLKKKSLFLRRLQNKQGKGTAYQSEDDYDFD